MKKLISVLLTAVLLFSCLPSGIVYGQRLSNSAVDEYLDKSAVKTDPAHLRSDATRVNPKYVSAIPDKNAGKSLAEKAFLDIIQQRIKAKDLQGVLDLSFYVLRNKDNPRDRSNAEAAAKLLNDLALRNALAPQDLIKLSQIYEGVFQGSKACVGIECAVFEQAALGLSITKNASVSNSVPVFDVEKRSQFTPTPNAEKARLMTSYLVNNLNQKESGNLEVADALLKSIAFVGGMDAYKQALSQLVTKSKLASRYNSVWDAGKWVSDKTQNITESIGLMRYNKYEIANYKIIERAFDMLSKAGVQAKPVYAEYAFNQYPLVANVQAAIGFRRLATTQAAIDKTNSLLRLYYCNRNLMSEENQEYLALRQKIVLAYYNGQKDPGFIKRPDDYACYVEWENDLDPNRLADQYTKEAVFQTVLWFAPEIIGPAAALRIGKMADAFKGLLQGGKIVSKEAETVKLVESTAVKAASEMKGAKLGADLPKGVTSKTGPVVDKNAVRRMAEVPDEDILHTPGVPGKDNLNPLPVPQEKLAKDAQSLFDEADGSYKRASQALKNAEQKLQDLSGEDEPPFFVMDMMKKDITRLKAARDHAAANRAVALANIEKLQKISGASRAEMTAELGKVEDAMPDVLTKLDDKNLSAADRVFYEDKAASLSKRADDIRKALAENAPRAPAREEFFNNLARQEADEYNRELAWVYKKNSVNPKNAAAVQKFWKKEAAMFEKLETEYITSNNRLVKSIIEMQMGEIKEEIFLHPDFLPARQFIEANMVDAASSLRIIDYARNPAWWDIQYATNPAANRKFKEQVVIKIVQRWNERFGLNVRVDFVKIKGRGDSIGDLIRVNLSDPVAEKSFQDVFETIEHEYNHILQATAEKARLNAPSEVQKAFKSQLPFFNSPSRNTGGWNLYWFDPAEVDSRMSNYWAGKGLKDWTDVYADPLKVKGTPAWTK